MKINLLLCTAMMLMLAGSFSCKQVAMENPDNFDISGSIYYVAGYSSPNVGFQDETAKSGGYLFISENLRDTLFASVRKEFENTYCGISILNDELYSFPKEIMPANVCGLAFFPKEYRYAYKVQMTYRLAPEHEIYTVLCTANLPVVNTRARHIIITSISKIQ
jgi:hypothetical protein